MGNTMARTAEQITIVGAGPGGLAAAMLLAQTGARVTVIERKSGVGGRCSAIEREGFRFDVGPTFFLYPRVLEEIFRTVGRDLWSEVPMTRLDPQYRLMFGGGGKLDATPDLDGMEREIATLSPADAPSFRRFMNENRRKLEKFRPILENPFSSMLDLARPEVLAAAPWVKPWLSVGGDLQRLFKDPRLVTAFSFQSKYLGMSPFQCPSLFTILAFLEYEYGVFHPEGGCSAVSDQMARITREMGVEIRLGESVESLDLRGRKVVGVETDEGYYPTDALVINGDFAKTVPKLVPNELRRSWNDRRIQRAKYSCSTFMMYLGIKGRYDDLPHHTIFLTEDLHKNIDQIQHSKVLPESPSFYIQNASINDPTLAPQGMSTLYVLVPVANLEGQTEWTPAQEAQFREFALKRLEAIGLTDLKDRIVTEKIMQPQRWHDELDVYKGATFNLSHTLTQMLAFRPRNRFEDLDGVYLVGGGTHPGSGLPVIFESARISTRLMAEDMGFNLDAVDREDLEPSSVAGLQLEQAS